MVPGGPREPRSPYRDYYVWRDEPPRRAAGASSSRTRRRASGAATSRRAQYYLHRFYRYQPDLNIANPAVRDEIAQDHGLLAASSGVSGFRVDAVPFLLRDRRDRRRGRATRPARAPARPARLHGPPRRRRDPARRGQPSTPTRNGSYFGGGDGDELHMLFDFIVMQASTSRSPAATPSRSPRRCARLPAIPDDAQWANFLRNHDELTLDKLTDARAPGGLRRLRPRPGHAALRARAAPPAADDARRRPAPPPDGLQPLFSLPGTPVLFYGEEIGMGENLASTGRLAVRTPMQWTAGPQRRLLHRAGRRGCLRPLRRARSARSASTSPTSAATPTRC